jgi:hypothetical protein
MIRHWLASFVAFALMGFAVVGCSTNINTAPLDPPAPPTLPEGLQPGWNEIATGGDTICSRGTEYAFFVRPGTVNKVVIDFIGGGACWNELTCGVADAIFNPDIENVRAAIAANSPAGMYDHDNADNPFKDWYHVILPYCTGDIHWGDNVKTYGSGDTEVTINHKGAVNTRAVLDWVYDNFSAPEDVFVTGCSAGAYGSIMWAPHVAEHYPASRLMQFGDSGAGIITQKFFEESFPSWNAESAFPTWIDALNPKNVNLLDLSLSDLYSGVANHYPSNQFSEYNTAFDENQTFYFTVMGGSGAAEWSEKMFASIDKIQASTPTFSSFIAPGEQHCIVLFDNFYTVNTGGVRLVEWLNTMVNGEQPPNAACTTNCMDPTP